MHGFVRNTSIQTYPSFVPLPTLFFLPLKGVAVSVVEPGFINTDMPKGVAKALSAWQSSFPSAEPEALEAYDAPMQAYGRQFNSTLNLLMGSVDDTTAAILHALQAPRPEPRYLVGLDATILGFIRYDEWERLDAKMQKSIDEDGGNQLGLIK